MNEQYQSNKNVVFLNTADRKRMIFFKLQRLYIV